MSTPTTSAPQKKRSGQRLAFLDWARGSVALVMLQGHVTHSFMRDDLRQESPYILSQFIGGMTPAVFLFLTGVTLGFLMDSRQKAGQAAGLRVLEAFKRAGYLLGLAFLFRFQMWAFSLGNSSWTDIFKVDILNAMALAIAVLAPLAVFETRDRIRFGLITGLFITCAAPVISSIGFNWLNPFVRSYFVPDHNYFSFFPWAAFVAFGLSAGSILRLAKEEDYMKVMQWGAMFGIALVVGARYFANLPYSMYSNADFWLNSPALVLIKLGVIYMLLSFAYLWTRFINPDRWSFVRQLGTTSLLVYWVHTELVYGSWFWWWKNSLTAAECALAAAGIIALMILLSVARTGWKGRPGLHIQLKQQWRQWRTVPVPAGD